MSEPTTREQMVEALRELRSAVGNPLSFCASIARAADRCLDLASRLPSPPAASESSECRGKLDLLWLTHELNWTIYHRPGQAIQSLALALFARGASPKQIVQSARGDTLTEYLAGERASSTAEPAAGEGVERRGWVTLSELSGDARGPFDVALFWRSVKAAKPNYNSYQLVHNLALHMFALRPDLSLDEIVKVATGGGEPLCPPGYAEGWKRALSVKYGREYSYPSCEKVDCEHWPSFPDCEVTDE